MGCSAHGVADDGLDGGSGACEVVMEAGRSPAAAGDGCTRKAKTKYAVVVHGSGVGSGDISRLGFWYGKEDGVHAWTPGPSVMCAVQDEVLRELTKGDDVQHDSDKLGIVLQVSLGSAYLCLGAVLLGLVCRHS
ncbi:hypothetical protein L1987_09979 [Smallanthus sonchifolius]|uniref:Uncharacterized protein n=1 Tax=Smallanthus sonchifolius TaxID=185202 RepID=A0ACB9JQT4_9ASTR|nr:hypothetical protein L1987_09979 [Smallanthus sonchifolius]